MNKKKQILCFVEYYLPGYKAGGPIRSISNMVEALNDCIEFYIVCRKNDINCDIQYKNININRWNTVGSANVYYLDSNFSGISRIVNLLKLKKWDSIYLNSFFSPYFSILPLYLIKIFHLNQGQIILASHGEFSNSALSIKWLKKYIYLKFFLKSRAYSNITFHASTQGEANDITNALHLPQSQIKIAKNLPSNKNCNSSFSLRLPGPLRIIFISRIAKMKNLKFIIDVLSQVKNSIEFSIYGPIEDRVYWAECLSRLEKLPANILFNFYGEVAYDHVFDVISRHDLLVLPTLGENYGHIIAEALHCSVPVLISDRTPWNATSTGAITIISLDKINDWIAEIEHWSNLSPESLIKIRELTYTHNNSIKCNFNLLEFFNLFKINY